MINLKGIDISSHNGTIDFAKVKSDGIKFAIIRAGFGNDSKSQDDKLFEANVKGCEANGIPWGAYLYSYALNLDDAKSEAAHMLRLLEGKKPSYPVYIDMEDADGYKKKNGMPSKQMLTDICLTFCEIVTKAGYVAGTYANRDWLTNKLYANQLEKYTIWLAVWADKPYYDGKYDIWQYISDGKVSGINGRVDMNISYKDFAAENPSKPEPPKPEPPPKPTPEEGKIAVGDRVKYSGRLYATSYGERPGKSVTGEFTVTTIVKNRSHGILLNNGLGWVAEKDCTKVADTKPPTPPSAPILPGDRVLLLPTATHYQTGQLIPKFYLNKIYTVQQVGQNRILLKELYSWVNTSDIKKV